MKKIIKDIKDLKFKLGEYFESEDILINNDKISISNRFAKLIIDDKRYYDINTNHKFFKTKISLKYNRIFLLDTFIYKNESNVKYPNVIAGASGSFGFGGLQYTKKETLGVLVRRLVIKTYIEKYLETNLYRIIKIKKLLNETN